MNIAAMTMDMFIVGCHAGKIFRGNVRVIAVTFTIVLGQRWRSQTRVSLACRPLVHLTLTYFGPQGNADVTVLFVAVAIHITAEAVSANDDTARHRPRENLP